MAQAADRLAGESPATEMDHPAREDTLQEWAVDLAAGSNQWRTTADAFGVGTITTTRVGGARPRSFSYSPSTGRISIWSAPTPLA
jgi:hypothetical protein